MSDSNHDTDKEHHGSPTLPRHEQLLIPRATHSVDNRLHASKRPRTKNPQAAIKEDQEAERKELAAAQDAARRTTIDVVFLNGNHLHGCAPGWSSVDGMLKQNRQVVTPISVWKTQTWSQILPDLARHLTATMSSTSTTPLMMPLSVDMDASAAASSGVGAEELVLFRLPTSSQSLLHGSSPRWVAIDQPSQLNTTVEQWQQRHADVIVLVMRRAVSQSAAVPPASGPGKVVLLKTFDCRTQQDYFVRAVWVYPNLTIGQILAPCHSHFPAALGAVPVRVLIRDTVSTWKPHTLTTSVSDLGPMMVDHGDVWLIEAVMSQEDVAQHQVAWAGRMASTQPDAMTDTATASAAASSIEMTTTTTTTSQRISCIPTPPRFCPTYQEYFLAQAMKQEYMFDLRDTPTESKLVGWFYSDRPVSEVPLLFHFCCRNPYMS